MRNIIIVSNTFIYKQIKMGHLPVTMYVNVTELNVASFFVRVKRPHCDKQYTFACQSGSKFGLAAMKCCSGMPGTLAA